MTKKTHYFMVGSAAVLAAGLCTGLVAYYAGGFQPVSASAVSDELRYVPANATVVAYANVRAIMDSELRARLKQAMPMQEQGQLEFQQQTGIDIESDIDYVVAAMLQPTLPAGAGGLVVARGRFDATLLKALALEHGGTVENYKGKELVVAPTNQMVQDQTGVIMPEHHKNLVLAFLENGLIAFGDATAVKSAIDAQLTSHITSNDEMMRLVGDIGAAAPDAWAVGRFDALASQADLPEQISRQIPTVKWLAVAGHVNGGLSGTLRAEARDDPSAENLRDVVRGFMALARLQSQSDPRTAGLVDSLQLSGSGRTVSLSFSVPSEILQLIPKAHGQPEQ